MSVDTAEADDEEALETPRTPVSSGSRPRDPLSTTECWVKTEHRRRTRRGRNPRASASGSDLLAQAASPLRLPKVRRPCPQNAPLPAALDMAVDRSPTVCVFVCAWMAAPCALFCRKRVILQRQ